MSNLPANLNTQATIWRRLFHAVAGSIIPFMGLMLASSSMINILILLSLLAVSLEVLRLSSSRINHTLTNLTKHLLKIDELRNITGATYMVVASLLVFLLFDKSIAVMSLFFLSIGDPTAALVGIKTRKYVVFDKSLIGTVAFILACFIFVSLLILTGAISFHWGLIVGAIVAGTVELLPSVIDDNITIPLASSTVMMLVGVPVGIL